MNTQRHAGSSVYTVHVLRRYRIDRSSHNPHRLYFASIIEPQTQGVIQTLGVVGHDQAAVMYYVLELNLTVRESRPPLPALLLNHQH